VGCVGSSVGAGVVGSYFLNVDDRSGRVFQGKSTVSRFSWLLISSRSNFTVDHKMTVVSSAANLILSIEYDICGYRRTTVL